MKFLIVLCAAAFALQGCGKKSSSSGSTSSGSSTPGLSGTYVSSCTAIPGATIGGATHQITMASFGISGDPAAFEFATLYASNSSCTTSAYVAAQQGTFAIGSTTTTPAGGYNITFTVTMSAVGVYTTTAENAMNSGCSSYGTWSTAPSLVMASSGFSCANIDIDGNINYYNVFALTGSTLSLGAPDDDNPGVLNSGSVPTTFSLSLTK